MIEPSYFGLTNDRTWISVDEEYYKKLKPTHRMKCYTHPAELTLTKEEIHAVWASGQYYTLDKDGSIDEFHFADFAKAILRKAQEK